MSKCRNDFSWGIGYIRSHEQPKTSRRNVESRRPTQRGRFNYAEMVLYCHLNSSRNRKLEVLVRLSDSSRDTCEPTFRRDGSRRQPMSAQAFTEVVLPSD